MNVNDKTWIEHFQIQSAVDLDFVVGQEIGHPVGMSRRSPPEFRRRVLAAAVSYQLRLRSIDYALKRYVGPETYEQGKASLGNETSDYLHDCTTFLEDELTKLHTVDDPTFGIFGAEITLYKVPHLLDTARMLANRGLLLEVLPILRLCLEMVAWAYVAFRMHDEEKIIALKAQNCVSPLKEAYATAGKLYGYLSTFAHWGQVIHGHFLDVEESRVAVLKASVRYRARALALCLIILDVFVEVNRKLYSDKSDALVLEIQGVLDRDSTRKTHQYLSKIAEFTGVNEMRKIRELLQ